MEKKIRVKIGLRGYSSIERRVKLLLMLVFLNLNQLPASKKLFKKLAFQQIFGPSVTKMALFFRRDFKLPKLFVKVSRSDSVIKLSPRTSESF